MGGFGFAKPGLPAEALLQYGIEAPLFFTPTNHTILFAGGGVCPGNKKRAVAIQFSCGSDVQVLQVAEVRQCAYIIDISHPAPCDINAWPKALREIAPSSTAGDKDLQSALQ